MEAKEVLRRYAAGERDFRGVDLRGQSFKGKNQSGADFSDADFSHADIRGTDFSHATLKNAKFVGATAGLTKRQTTLLFLLLCLGKFGVAFAFGIGSLFLKSILEVEFLQNSIVPGVVLLIITAFSAILLIVKGYRRSKEAQWQDNETKKILIKVCIAFLFAGIVVSIFIILSAFYEKLMGLQYIICQNVSNNIQKVVSTVVLTSQSRKTTKRIR